MKVVHFSMTRLAGAPIRLVQALRAWGGAEQLGLGGAEKFGTLGRDPAPRIDARLVDLDHWGHYDTDVVFSASMAARDEAVALAEEADVIHLHNYLGRESRQFAPIDFGALEKKGKRLVRHFHSTPEIIASMAQTTVDQVLGDTIPSLVIAQYPERFYPRAMVVPNIVPERDPAYMPPQGCCADTGPLRDKPRYDVVFSPTKLTSAWEDRWNTKGAPETTAMIEAASLTAGTGRIRVVNDRPLSEVLQAKREARIVVDDLVNGSYHLSGLEGLCLARPVLAWLDDRARLLLLHFANAASCPYVNVRLEEARPVLEYLLQDEDLCLELGRAGREWVEKHWSSAKHAAFFAKMYQTLLENPDNITRQPELALDTPLARFKAVEHHELVFEARRARAVREQSG